MKLKDVHSPQDIKHLSIEELKDLAQQMREATLKRTSDIGGHVGPNLGVVETIMAMHYVFDAPKDKLVYDVSHQDFPHKMLTGRAYGYLDPQDYSKVGEYTEPTESPEYDNFFAGHTSPSISLSLGLAKARELQKQDYNIVVLIGDGALSGGEAFEGLNAVGALDSNFIIILNDNQMAIAEDHGGIYTTLQQMRETNGTSENNLFKAFNLDYMYVADGNDVEKMIEVMKKVKDIDHPIVVHVNTQKGEGYVPAERNREAFHYRAPYQISSGALAHTSNNESYTTVSRDWFLEKAKNDPRVLLITSATPDTFGLDPNHRKQLGKQYIDVAIAEQTGVSTLAGAAKGGAKPIYPVTATFLQRAYDQIIEDFALNDNPGVMVLFDSGIAGIKDVTHLGIWDVAMLSNVANLVYLAPTNVEEYIAMLDWATDQDKYPVALRVPCYGGLVHAKNPDDVDKDYSDINKFKVVKEGSKVAIIGVGDFFPMAEQTVELLAQNGVDATLINPRYLTGVDTELLKSLEADHQMVVTLEDNSVEGGFGEKVARVLGESPLKVKVLGLPKQFIDRYNIAQHLQSLGLTPENIAKEILASL